jgi:hypothetical protein
MLLLLSLLPQQPIIAAASTAAEYAHSTHSSHTVVSAACRWPASHKGLITVLPKQTQQIDELAEVNGRMQLLTSFPLARCWQMTACCSAWLARHSGQQ